MRMPDDTRSLGIGHHNRLATALEAHPSCQTTIPLLTPIELNEQRVNKLWLSLTFFYLYYNLSSFKQLFQHNLIYDILSKLTANLTEKSVECVLLTLRSIGFSLRKDDAIALKDLIATLQRKTNEATEEFKNK